MKYKLIAVSKEAYKKLGKIRLEKEMRSFGEVVNFLLKNQKRKVK